MKHLNCCGNGWNFTFIYLFTYLFKKYPQHLRLSRVAASLPIDGAAFSVVLWQKPTHSCANLLSGARTGATGHAEPSLCSLKPRASEESRSIVSRLSCVARGGHRLMRRSARVHTEVRGAAATPPSLGWQFVSTWRWFTTTARCIADLPAERMVGWSGLESCSV